MKKEDVPQDTGALGRITREVCYATDGSGKYTTELSSGWEVKTTALDVTWETIAGRISAAREQVLQQEASPLLFFMEYRLMDIALLADYTGFWQWQIRRHLKPKHFKALSAKQLQKYADAFNISITDLNTPTVHEG